MEAALMKDSIERLVKDLGAIHIDNLIGTEEPQTSKSGLYSEDYDPTTGRFSYPTDERVSRQ